MKSKLIFGFAALAIFAAAAAETYGKFAPRGYEMIAVAMSYDHPNQVAEFGDVRATPTSFVLDRRGRVLKQILGEPEWRELHALVEKALAESA